jgi:TRAP-type C4-dicarboxylate transport system permease small subunit
MLEKLNKLILKIENFILGYGIIFIAVLLVINVFSRSVLNNSLKFAEELGQFMMIIITFVGISTTSRFSKNINMNAIIDNLPRKTKKIFMLIISFFTSLVMFYVSYLCFLYAHDIYKVGRISTAMEIPMWIIISIVFAGVFLSAVQFLICFIKNIFYKNEIYLGSQVKCGEDFDLIYEDDEYNKPVLTVKTEDKIC